MKGVLNKRIFANSFLIIFPIIIIWAISNDYNNHDIIIQNGFNYFTLVIGGCPYFISLIVYIHMFYINKQDYNLFALFIGIGELIIMQIPQIMNKISYDLFVILYSELYLTLFICIGTILMYLLLLVQHYRLKKEVN